MRFGRFSNESWWIASHCYSETLSAAMFPARTWQWGRRCQWYRETFGDEKYFLKKNISKKGRLLVVLLVNKSWIFESLAWEKTCEKYTCMRFERFINMRCQVRHSVLLRRSSSHFSRKNGCMMTCYCSARAFQWYDKVMCTMLYYWDAQAAISHTRMVASS